MKRLLTLSLLVTLDAESSLPVSASYATHDGTAKAGWDYTQASGTVSIAAGDVSQTIDLPVYDETYEAVGETFPLHCTANGKAYLAGLETDAIARLIGASYEQRTPRTLTRLEDLLKDLKSVRKTGVAFDREEHTQGICAAGVATRDPLGNVIAISVPVPAQRFYQHQRNIAAQLRATKEALERRLLAAAA